MTSDADDKYQAGGGAALRGVMKTQNTFLRSAAITGFALAVMVTAIVLRTDGFAQSATTGVIAFQDARTGSLYAVRGDGSGRCLISKSAIPKKTQSVMFTITNVTQNMRTYDAVTNHDPDGDSNGISITVPR